MLVFFDSQKLRICAPSFGLEAAKATFIDVAVSAPAARACNTA